jgi:metallophosphoesterase superfamily enzyme
MYLQYLVTLAVSEGFSAPDGKLNIAGHVHPGYLVKTKSRQHYRLPCFYHHRQLLLIPAFGHLTGLHLLEKKSGSRIFPVLPEQVIEWH